MRAAVAVLAGGLLATVLLAGCGRPAGVDGDLTDHWPALGPATVPVPPAGVCYPRPYAPVWTGDFRPVDCAGTHLIETAYVGSFTGADADRAGPPPAGSPALATAYRECQRRADEYLGGDWHSGLIGLGLVRPDAPAWTGGARWFRCDLIHYADALQAATVDHGSLRGDLAGARTAGYGCLATTQVNGSVVTAVPVGCARPHAAEFAGTFTAPDIPWPTDPAARTRLGDKGCEPVVAGFLGYPGVAQWRNNQIGWWELSFDGDQWALGDRTIQCFAYAFTKSGTMVGSVQGIRDQAPKS